MKAFQVRDDVGRAFVGWGGLGGGVGGGGGGGGGKR
jgi:hypothetical protein